jgi:predicted DNA-binding transcriptional regulator AlpA
MQQLPETGYIRLVQIVGNLKAEPPIPAIIPVSKSTWWAGIKSGLYPAPVKLGPRITAWRAEDIRELIDQLDSKASVHKKCNL